MKLDHIVIEIRFDAGDRSALDTSLASLRGLDVETSDTARDPAIATALTVAASVTTLVVEVVKLIRELRDRGQTRPVVMIKLGRDNKEHALKLLDATDGDVEQFLLEE